MHLKMYSTFKYLVVLSALLGAVLAADGSNNSTATNTTLSFDRVLIVLLENQPLKASLKNPLMKEIISKGTLLTEYYGLVNPSQPNYIGLLAGDLMGVKDDDVHNIDGLNLVDLLEAKNVSWKSYQEDYPGGCYANDVTPDRLYKRKHNPFISFNNIRDNEDRCAKIVNADELAGDLMTGAVPQYSFYTPNMNNNGHDTGLDYAAKWLSSVFLPAYLTPFNKTGNALLVITFDEGVPGDNKIYTLLIGDMIPDASVDTTRYDHYSLLRLVEENYGLGSLNRHDKTAVPITKATFVKGTPNIDDDANLVLALTIVMPILCVGAIIGILYLFRKRAQKRLQMRDADKSQHQLLLSNYGDDDYDERV